MVLAIVHGDIQVSVASVCLPITTLEGVRRCIHNNNFLL